MDYEKKYKEAVNKIRDLLDDGEKNGFTIVTYKTDLESIFPELKESEDEKVRKEIVEYLKKNLRLEWATWLDKQGEFYTKKDVDNAYLEGMAFAKNELEKQAEVVSDKDDIEAEEKGIRKAFNKIWEEKQDKQKSQRMISAEAKEAMYDKPADTVEQKFKVKYAGSEYNVLEIKEIAGDTYYGIEDEPNHIDYVLPDYCEIVSEQKSAWSEDDEKMLVDAYVMLDWYKGNNWWTARRIKDWLNSLKERIGE